MTPHVVVLAGGLSHERDVSLRSGARLLDALRDQGLDVAQRDSSSLQAIFTIISSVVSCGSFMRI